jgi:hypothetical protein
MKQNGCRLDVSGSVRVSAAILFNHDQEHERRDSIKQAKFLGQPIEFVLHEI